MTKKDYIVIARVFNATTDIWVNARAQWIVKNNNEASEAKRKDNADKIDGINKILASLDVIVKGLCYELKKDNPKFDAEKFMKVCGLPDVKAGGNDKVVSEVATGLEDSVERLRKLRTRQSPQEKSLRDIVGQ